MFRNISTYEGESVNRTKIDITRKTCDIRTWRKHLFLDIYSIDIDAIVLSLNQGFNTGNIEIFWLLSQPFPHPLLNLINESFATQLWTALRNKHFPQRKGNISLWISFCPQKTHNRMLFFISTLLQHGRHFDYWNQILNLSIRFCNLHCHETGLCCYLIIRIEYFLQPLQLFYLHLWTIYWLSLVIGKIK
jgi:hypothetical protein